MAARPRWEWWRRPETLVCGVRGHVVPAGGASDVPSEWRDLLTTTAEGLQLGRCLRCDAWLTTDCAGVPLDRLSRSEVPRRGKPLRDAIVLRAISIERAVHALVFGLAAIGLAFLRFDLPGLQAQARDLAKPVGGTFAGPGQAASRNIIIRELHRLLSLRQGTLGLLALTAAVYCVLEGTEAVGLWFEQRWAEYLTALVTAGLLPFELKELADRVTAVRIGALIINLAVLVWLVWRKHLFGVGGRQREEDRLAALRASLGPWRKSQSTNSPP